MLFAEIDDDRISYYVNMCVRNVCMCGMYVKPINKYNERKEIPENKKNLHLVRDTHNTFNIAIVQTTTARISSWGLSGPDAIILTR